MLQTLTTRTAVLLLLMVSSATAQKAIQLKGHTGAVVQVAFAPSGRLLASGGWDETVCLWDLAGGPPRHTLTEHTDWVLAVTFTPDGKRLLTASQRTVKAWDATTGALLQNWKGLPGQRISTLVFSRDGRQLACGLRDGGLLLYRLEPDSNLSAAPRISLKAHTSWIDAIAFAYDGKTLATGSRSGEIKIWTTGEGKLRATPAGHAGLNAAALAFSPNGRQLASGSYDTTVKVWNPADGKELATLKGHKGIVLAVAFSADSLRLASGERHGPIKLWGTKDFKLETTLPGHSGGQLGFSVHSLSFAPDGKQLASGGRDRLVKLWKVVGN